MKKGIASETGTLPSTLSFKVPLQVAVLLHHCQYSLFEGEIITFSGLSKQVADSISMPRSSVTNLIHNFLLKSQRNQII